MIKINTFSMAFSKLIAYFISKLKYFFFLFFHMVNIWPPKKCNLPANIFEDFSYGA